MHHCKTIGCTNHAPAEQDFCNECLSLPYTKQDEPQSLSERYPQYYKSVGNMSEVDVYAVHHLFQINDPSGCLQHASKKLLLSGVRTGGKSVDKDIKEARDTLTRWLQLHSEE